MQTASRMRPECGVSPRRGGYRSPLGIICFGPRGGSCAVRDSNAADRLNDVERRCALVLAGAAGALQHRQYALRFDHATAAAAAAACNSAATDGGQYSHQSPGVAGGVDPRGRAEGGESLLGHQLLACNSDQGIRTGVGRGRHCAKAQLQRMWSDRP